MLYMRAFFKALRLTLRGERYIRPYDRLWVWIEEGAKVHESLKSALKAADFNAARQKEMTIRIEGREMSIGAILGGVEYHLNVEYPYLLQHFTEHSITGIYATNMNDQYYVSRLVDVEVSGSQDVNAALKQLNMHLHSIPPSTEIENSES